MAELDALLTRLHQVRRELVERLNDVEKLIKETEALRGRVLPVLAAPGSDNEKSRPEPVSNGPAEIASAVREILIEADRPMRRGEIAEALTRRGIVVPGADKSKNVGTIIWRHSREFISLPNLGYWLKDRPIKGIYDPDEDSRSD
jgi:hypothetical protein